MLDKKFIVFGILLILGVVAFSGCTSDTNITSTKMGANEVAIQNMGLQPIKTNC